MLRALLIALAAWCPTAASTAAADLPAGSDLVARSIAYHDPAGAWGRVPLDLTLRETRPAGGDRVTRLLIDLEAETFTWSSQRQGREVAGALRGGSCELTLDGERELSEEEAETYRLSCERVAWLRDYYTYLYGLPMKLRDPGARVGEEVTETEFEGRPVLAVRVTYDEEVGGDVWYFYFDPATSALAGYRFYHDEAKNDGEYITLDGEFEVSGMKLPRTRAWYYNDGRGYLGTDTLVGIRPSAE